MRSSLQIPDPEKVSIPLFYGMLNEELNFDDKAESAYVRVVLRSLQQISASYGYSMPESLNDFHLLGRLWETEHKVDLLNKLDEVYALLEDRHLAALRQRNDVDLDALKSRLDGLRINNSQQSAAIKALEAEKSAASREVTTRIIAAVVTISFLILVLVICLINGYRYARGLSAHKAYGFVAKAVETLGWIRVMSVIGVVTGLLTVIVAQLLLIFQRIHEDLSTQRQQPTPVLGENSDISGSGASGEKL
jgi:hypothetical protein